MPNNQEKEAGDKQTAAEGFQIRPPSISLPKGGGAIRGIGEKFAANPVTGTGSMTVPIATSPGRSGFGPQLSLSYDSGSGNGPFGFGWSLSLPLITRKTDKGLPRYWDAEESDEFILSGAEDLVPEFEKDAGSNWVLKNGKHVIHDKPRNINGKVYNVRRYRSRIEGLFARIERWTNQADPTDVFWRSISRDNITTWYGKTENSRIADPHDKTRIFSWLICQSYDDKGNAIVYEYAEEGSQRIFEDQTGDPISLAHEHNRDDKSRSANRYLKRIKYGNLKPNRDLATWQATDPTNLKDWMFEVVFDYGEGHYSEQKAPDPSHHDYALAQIEPPAGSFWPVRQDPFSSYRAGFEVRTYRLCHRVLMFHHFPDELGIDDYLVRSTEFTYEQSPIASFITSVTQSGYRYIEDEKKYLKKSLPPLEFEYTKVPSLHEFANLPIQEIDSRSLENLPIGLDGRIYQWVDLDGEGISSILTEQADAWFYKPNRGNGQFGPLDTVAAKPSLAALSTGRQQLLDLAGDGQLDLVQFSGSTPGFYERTQYEDWEPFKPFISLPNIPWDDPNLRFVDLNGDGHADVLITKNEAFTWYPSLAEKGFRSAQHVRKPLDEEKGPKLVFADGTQSIYLADLSGDGLSDLVRIRNNEICYWPNLGYGLFGAKVTMDKGEWSFDFHDQFDQRRIRLADTDGSGTTDIIYLGRDSVRIYLNQSGNRWSDPVPLPQFPPVDNLAFVQALDLRGNGTACLVWSSSTPEAKGCPMRYLELMGSPILFSARDIKNFSSFVARLQNGSDPVSKFIRDHFPGDTVTLLDTHDGSASSTQQLTVACVKGLNEIIQGACIYENQLFDEVKLRKTTSDLLLKNPQGTELILLNRLLLEDAYPLEIVRKARASKKPHLLTKFVNNLGAETVVHYAPSTKFYLEDKLAGKPWVTKLPFPVHVIERIETYDHISCNRFVTRYAYHHGYFDGREREFRGFGMVEQWDTEEFKTFNPTEEMPLVTNADLRHHVPPIYSKTWFHTGAYLGRNHVSDFFAGMLNGNDIGEYFREPAIRDDDTEARKFILEDTVLPNNLSLEEEREACRALKGAMLRQEVYALDDTGTDDFPHGLPYTVAEQNFTIRRVQAKAQNSHGIFFVHPREAINYQYERNADDPRISHTITLAVDDYGNVLRSVAIAYRRRPGPDLKYAEQAQTHITLTANWVENFPQEQDWYRIGLPIESRSFEIVNPWELMQSNNRVVPFTFGKIESEMETLWPKANPEPAAEKLWPYENWDWRRQAEQLPANTRLRLIEDVRTIYRKDDLTDFLELGFVEPKALPGESFKLAFTPELLTQVYQQPLSEMPPEDRLQHLAEIIGGQDGDQGGYVVSQTLKNRQWFPSSDPNDYWWLPSGQAFYLPNADHDNPANTATAEKEEAIKHFYLPRKYVNPFKQSTIVTFDQHDLLITQTSDAVENTITAIHSYRVLQPHKVTDPNGNRTQVSFDTLGLVAGTAIMGREIEGVGDTLTDFETDLAPEQIAAFYDADDPRVPAVELLKEATSRIVYDLDRLRNSRNTNPDNPELWEPVFAASLARETHASDPLPLHGLKIQIGFNYSDGFGREIQKKIQAEPGPVFIGGPDVNPRWVGSGWTIFNNKGKPVMQFEPFFSQLEQLRHRFEFGVQVGVSPVLFYDPVERVIATLHPNQTYEKVDFNPWQQTTYDVNDTVSFDPRTDNDISGFVNDYLASQPAWETWLQQRITDPQNPPPDTHGQNAEQDAAVRTLQHADTPTVAHFNTLGRAFLTIADNGKDEGGNDQHYTTQTILDIEGNQREVIDAKERIVMRYAYDMLGNRIHQVSMEAGSRWMLNDVTGNTIRTWDSRGHTFRTVYDPLRRPLRVFVTGADSENLTQEILTERLVYGEQHPQHVQRKLRGQLYLHFDQAGMVSNEAYDFKSNLLSGSRRITNGHQYRNVVNWQTVDADHTALPTDPIAPLDLDALQAAIASRLEAEAFVSSTTYDALNRPIQLVSPHLSDMQPNIIRPVYNEANLLERLDVNLQSVSEAGVPVWTNFVTNINYNAKGQREFIVYSNGVSTHYKYDTKTFRLIHLQTTRDPGAFIDDCPQPPSDDWPGCDVQNLHYTFDPVGNITHIKDTAQQTIYFKNRRVDPSNDYFYDAIYRLIEATGREHLGQTGSAVPHSYNDAPRVGIAWSANDGNAMGRYCENYIYDEVGNIKEMIHRRSCPGLESWRRDYTYAEKSQIEDGSGGMPEKISNRLTSTTVGTAPSEPYTYDSHGNTLSMPQLQMMRWDYKNQLQMSQRQKINDDDDGKKHHGEKTYYVYNSAGQRLRKVTELSTRKLKNERIYLGGFELFIDHTQNPKVVRETLHIMDDKQRIALIETRTQGDEPDVAAQLSRYQFSSHLGSVSLELNEQAQPISYEEYSPYGSTTYQAVDKTLKAAAKRYRYIGKERDEESGLNYHGARYYAEWLGKWISTDPSGLNDGPNLYLYTRGNPMMFSDTNGMGPDEPQEMSFWQKAKAFLLDPEYYNSVRKEAGITTGVEKMQERVESGEIEFTEWGAEQAEGVLPAVAKSAKFAKDVAPYIAVAGAAAPALGIAGGSAVVVNAITATPQAIGTAAVATKGAITDASIKFGMLLETEAAIAKTALETYLGKTGAGVALGTAEAYLTAQGLSQGLPMEVVNPGSLLASGKALQKKLSDAELLSKSADIADFLRAKGVIFEETTTIGVLQGELNGEIVTLIAANNKNIAATRSALLEAGLIDETARIIEPVQMLGESARTGNLIKNFGPEGNWKFFVDAEQALAVAATKLGLLNSRVSTSIPGCPMCSSTMGKGGDIWPEILHLNPSQ